MGSLGIEDLSGGILDIDSPYEGVGNTIERQDQSHPPAYSVPCLTCPDVHPRFLCLCSRSVLVTGSVFTMLTATLSSFAMLAMLTGFTTLVTNYRRRVSLISLGNRQAPCRSKAPGDSKPDT